MWLALGLLAFAIAFAALFAPSRIIYVWLEKRGATRRFVVWLVAAAILLIPASAFLATASDRLREARLAGIVKKLEPVMDAVSRGVLGPVESNNSGTSLVSVLSGGEIQRTPSIQYQPIELRVPGAERLSSEDNLPFYVLDRELQKGEMLKFPAAPNLSMDRIAVATPHSPAKDFTTLDITIVGPGASRRLFVIDEDTPSAHGWGEGDSLVKIRSISIEPPIAGASAIELRSRGAARVAGICQIWKGIGTPLTSEELTRTGLPVRAPATGGGRGVLLSNGRVPASFYFSEPIECDRLWLIYTSTDPRAVDYRWFGEDIVELTVGSVDANKIENFTLKHGEDVHSGNLDRSRHADDLASAAAFSWERDGARWHADQRKIEFDGPRKIKTLQIRNVAGPSGYSVELLGITVGKALSDRININDTRPGFVINGPNVRLSEALKGSFVDYTFAFADRRGVVRAGRGESTQPLLGVTIDDTDLSEIVAGRSVAPRCGSIAGMDGDLAFLPIRDGDSVVGALIIFSPEKDRPLRRGKFAFIFAAVFILISPLLIISFAESVARGESIRRKIGIALAIGSVVPAGALLLILPGSFESSRFDSAARRLDAELKLLRERLSRDREVAPATASAFLKSLREHPRAAPNFLPPARPDLDIQLKKELAIARKATFHDRPSFARLELKFPGTGAENWRTIDDSDAPVSFVNVDFQGSDYYRIQDSLYLVSVDRWSQGDVRARLILGVQVAIGSGAGERERIFDLTGASIDKKNISEAFGRDAMAEFIDNAARGNRAVVRMGDPSAAVDVFRDLDSNPIFAYAIIERGGRGEVSIFGARVPLTYLLGFVVVLAILGTLAIARILTEKLTRPIEQLASAADAARRGNIIIPADVGSADEVGGLAERFHTLSSELVRRIEHLNELHRGMWSFAGRLDRAEVAREASRFAANSTNADVAIIIIPDPHGVGWRSYLSNGKDRPAALTPLLQKIISADEWMLIQNEGPDSLQIIRGPRELSGGDFATIWAGPIRLGARNEGFLILTFSSIANVGQRESARAAAGAIAIALENARAYGLAIEDSATHALVPHFFEMRVNEALDRARALAKRICIIRWAILDPRGADGTEKLMIKTASRARRYLEQKARAVLGRLGPAELIIAFEDPGDAVRERLLQIFQNVSNLTAARLGAPFPEIDYVIFPDQGPSLTALLRILRRETAAGPASESLQKLAGEIEVRSEGMRDVLSRASRLLNIDVPILINGEADTGKEFLAKRMHLLNTNLLKSKAAKESAPFVVCSTGQLASGLAEAELFGVQAGAFSGAEKTRMGIFEQANGGTLLFSEIQECPLEMQSKILRVIQERSVRRLGSQQNIPLSIRIIATASKDLTELVRQGLFRADLYYRIAGALLNIPPLRDRKDDIPALCSKMLSAIQTTKNYEISSGAMERLMNHSWPGNFAELYAVLTRATVLAGDRDTLITEDIEIARMQPTSRIVHKDISRPVLDSNRSPVARGAERSAGDAWNERQTRLLAMLAKGDRITTGDYVAMMNVSTRTGLRDLVELARKGRLRQEGRKRGTAFKML